MKTWAAASLIFVALWSGCLDLVDPEATQRPPPPPENVLIDCSDHGFPQNTTSLKIPLLPIVLNASLETNRGSIAFELYTARSPITVCNFVQYALEDYYVDTVFHRICQHVIQAGGITNPYTGTSKPGDHPPIKNEANLSQLRNYKYTFGMARNSTPDSASTHFFINNRDNNYLDFDSTRAGVPPGFAVFANITVGQGVADEIARSLTMPEPDDVASQTGLVGDACSKAPAPGEETVIEKIRIDA